RRTPPPPGLAASLGSWPFLFPGFPHGLVVNLEPFLAIRDVVLRGRAGGLGEHPGDHDGIRIDPVDDPPTPVLIPDSDLMAPRGAVGRGPRVRPPERFTTLAPAQQDPGPHPRLGRERRRLDLAAEPRQRLPGRFLSR